MVRPAALISSTTAVPGPTHTTAAPTTIPIPPTTASTTTSLLPATTAGASTSTHPTASPPTSTTLPTPTPTTTTRPPPPVAPIPPTTTTAPVPTTTVPNPGTTTALPAPTATQAPPVPAGSNSGSFSVGAEADFVSRINGLRASLGLKGLATNAVLVNYARWGAKQMADSGKVAHSNIGSLLLNPWSVVSENVANGASVISIFNALVASPSHYPQMVDPLFTAVGVGAYLDSTGRLWTAQVFGG